MKIEHDSEFIYLYFESDEHANNGALRELIIDELRQAFKTMADPQATQSMFYDTAEKRWVFDCHKENLEILKGIVGTSTSREQG